WWVKWDVLNDVTTPVGQHFNVDRVGISPDIAGLSLGGLTRVSFQMPGPERLVFIREAASRRGLNFSRNQHFALGQATLTTSATGNLIIGNIGASGADGCEITYDDADWCGTRTPSIPL